MPMLGAKKTNKNHWGYCTFELTGVVPSNLQQPPADTPTQSSTNDGHVTPEGGKANVETYKNMKIELSLIRKHNFRSKMRPPIPRAMVHGVVFLSVSVEAAGRENL